MEPLAKALILGGVILIPIRFLFQIGGRFFMLERLPRDIVIERENFKFYFPLTTSLLLSALLTLLFLIFKMFKIRAGRDEN